MALDRSRGTDARVPQDDLPIELLRARVTPMLMLAIAWLSCLACVLELVHRAPIIDDADVFRSLHERPFLIRI